MVSNRTIFLTALRMLGIWLILVGLVRMTGAVGPVELMLVTLVAILGGIAWGYLLPKRS